MSNVLWGLVFVIFGVVLGLNALEITNITIFFDGWWTLFIIVPCFIGLFKEKEKTGNIIGLVIGACLLLTCQDIIDFDLIWKLMIPVVLVMIGLSFIFKDSINKKVKKEIEKLNKKVDKEYSAIFGEQKLNFANEVLENTEFSAVFGSLKGDLKESIINDNILINASAIFGGITLYVPGDVNVKISATPIFGSVVDHRKNKKETTKTIYLNATCMFGSIDIK